jgi:hypothetical protein
LCLKTDSYGLVILALESPRRFLGLSLKIKQASVCRLRLKTDGRATTWGHTLGSSGLLCVEASWNRVFQSDLQTDGGVTSGGARDTIVKVALESS